MKNSTALLLTILLLTTINSLQAQQIRCIICPDAIGISEVESGASIQNLTPVTELSNETTPKKVEKIVITRKSPVVKEEQVMGFVAKRELVPTSDEDMCNDPVDCGLITEEEMEEGAKNFEIYPNPAHHWMIINKKELKAGDYKVLIKDVEGKVIEDLMLNDEKMTLNLRKYKKGVYFITLRNESNYNEWVQKVTVQ